jgi:molybdopterin molybdotransferase
MIPIHDALEQMLPHFAPRDAVRVPLERALALYLADEIRVREDSPPYDNSAMDGYAVRAREATRDSPETPVRLPVAGESSAGGPLPGPLPDGAAMRIFTGAPMPAGADTVVMQEDTERDGDDVRILAPVRPGGHVRRAAEDLRAGAVMLGRNRWLGPGAIGLLASQGYAHVLVHRPPRVAILSTGDELRDVSDPPRPGTIVDSNTHALAAQVRLAGGVPIVLPRAPDDPAALARRLSEGLRADLVLSCGGVSVGEHDHVHEAFSRAGVDLLFWKVAIKPGKPFTFAVGGGVPVAGLPGNPVSAMVTFQILVLPGLRRMLGDPRPHPRPVAVQLARSARHKRGRTELLRATLRTDGPRLVAEAHPRQGSGALPSMSGADALVVLPAGQETFEAGARLWALPLRGGFDADRSPFAPGGPLHGADTGP